MGRMLFLSILGTPDTFPRDQFEGMAEGSKETAWTLRRLEEVGATGGISFAHVDVCAGERLPADARGYDAVMVGGSYHNVNEGHDWQRRAIEWLQRYRERELPFFGICGGHQMAAVALGGSVNVMEQGPNARTGPVELTNEGRAHFLFDGFDTAPNVHLGHFDHVDRMPVGARVLARVDGKIMAADFGNNWTSVQFHPEASDVIMTRAWEGNESGIRPAYRPTRDGGRIIANFLRHHGLLSKAP